MTDQMIDFVVSDTTETDQLPAALMAAVEMGRRIIQDNTGKAQLAEAAKQIETEKRRQGAEERIVKAYKRILPEYLHEYILIEPFDVHYGPARVELDLVAPGLAPIRFYLEAAKPEGYKLTAFRVASYRFYNGEYAHLGSSAIYSIEYRYNPDSKAFTSIEDLPVALAEAHEMGLKHAEQLKEIERLNQAEDRYLAEQHEYEPPAPTLAPSPTTAELLYKTMQMVINEVIIARLEQA